jgi:hypothetical protein
MQIPTALAALAALAALVVALLPIGAVLTPSVPPEKSAMCLEPPLPLL